MSRTTLLTTLLGAPWASVKSPLLASRVISWKMIFKLRSINGTAVNPVHCSMPGSSKVLSKYVSKHEKRIVSVAFTHRHAMNYYFALSISKLMWIIETSTDSQ
jgi:hypothetical protein